MIRNQKTFASIAAIFCAVVFQYNNVAHGEISLFKPGHQKGGWQGFGVGFDDSSANVKNNEIQIHVDWSRATWGIGVMYKLPESMNGKKIKALRVKIKSMKGSLTSVFAGVAAKDDVSIEMEKKKAFNLSDQWQIFEFPFSEMKVSKPGSNSKIFAESDWGNIQKVKFLFTKPSEVDVNKDVLLVRKPEFVLAAD